MRILLSAPNDKPWSFGGHLAIALEEMGLDCRLFDYRSARDPKGELIEVAAVWRPELHIIWKGELYDPATLSEVARHGVFQVLWYPDGLLRPYLPELAGACDLCCTQGIVLRDELRRLGLPRVERVLEGMTPSCYRYDSLTEEDRRRYACDVTMIGTLFGPKPYLKRIHALNRLIREGFRVRWWGPQIRLRNVPLREYFSPARRAWAGGHVWGPSLAKVCRAASIVLNLPRTPERAGGVSNGVFMTTGAGGFLLMRHKEGIEEFFDPGREIAEFHDEEEMVRQVYYYLDHPEERNAIAEAGQRRTLADHTNHHAIKRLLDFTVLHGGPAAGAS